MLQAFELVGVPLPVDRLGASISEGFTAVSKAAERYADAFSAGYQEALGDIDFQLKNGGIEAVQAWIKNNTVPKNEKVAK